VNKYLDKEVVESARHLIRGLDRRFDKACLLAVQKFGAGHEPVEVLGDLLRAIRERFPEEYWQAFRNGSRDGGASLCAVCEAPFKAQKFPLYCSNTCRKKAQRQRLSGPTR